MSARTTRPWFPAAIAALLALVTGCSVTGMVDRATGEDVNREIRQKGLPARATVVEIWDTGVTVNDDPVVGFRLEVEAVGRPQWRAETRALVSLLAIPRVQPGAVLPVRYDPSDPSRVAIDAGGEEEPPPEPVTGPIQLADDLTVEPLADGVWLHVSYQDMPEWGRVGANGLVVLSGGEAALVDTPWTDDQTRALVDWVAKRWGARVSTVVPTHSHQDCMGGLHAAHRAGARSFASVRTVELAREKGPEPPQVGFTDRLEVGLGERTLVLRDLGPGHTVDCIVVWIPDVEVLFGGDLIRSAGSRSLGYTTEADLERWPATVDAVDREYGHARLIVPGHGRPGGRELVERTRELLRQPPTR